MSLYFFFLIVLPARPVRTMRELMVPLKFFVLRPGRRSSCTPWAVLCDAMPETFRSVCVLSFHKPERMQNFPTDAGSLPFMSGALPILHPKSCRWSLSYAFPPPRSFFSFLASSVLFDKRNCFGSPFPGVRSRALRRWSLRESLGCGSGLTDRPSRMAFSRSRGRLPITGIGILPPLSLAIGGQGNPTQR